MLVGNQDRLRSQLHVGGNDSLSLWVFLDVVDHDLVAVGGKLEVGIGVDNALVAFDHVDGVPHADKVGIALDLGGVGQNTVVDEERLEEHWGHIEAEDSEDTAEDDEAAHQGLDDVVEEIGSGEGLVDVLVDTHGQDVVVTDIFEVVEAVLVDAAEVTVDELEGSLGVTVVDAVVVAAIARDDVDNVEGDLEQALAFGFVEEAVGVEGVAFVNAGVGQGGGQDLGAVEDQQRGQVEGQEEEGAVVELGEEDADVGVEANGFDDELLAIHLFTAEVLGVKDELHDQEGAEVVDGGQGDEGDPDIREDAGHVGDVTVMGSNVAATEGFLGRTGEHHHGVVNAFVKGIKSGHLGRPVGAHVHDLFLADGPDCNSKKWSKPNSDVVKVIQTEVGIAGEHRKDGNDHINGGTELDVTEILAGVAGVEILAEPFGKLEEILIPDLADVTGTQL